MKNIKLKLSFAALLVASLTSSPLSASIVNNTSTATSPYSCETKKITGDAGISGFANFTLDQKGAVTKVEFTSGLPLMATGELATQEFNELISTTMSNIQAGNIIDTKVMSVSLDLNDIKGSIVWSAADFTFTSTQIVNNTTTGASGSSFTSLTIIGVLSHPSFIDSPAMFSLTTQALHYGQTTSRSYSTTSSSL